MKVKLRLLVILSLLVLVLLPVSTTWAACPPSPPQLFTGSVTIDGSPAPDGTSVTAEVGGVEVASTTTSGGTYGIEICPDDYAGQTVVFKVNGVYGGEAVCPATAGESITVDLVITGEPDISVSPTSKNFGDVQVGSSSAPQTFTVSNEGTADLEVGTITLGGTNADQFSIQNDNVSEQTIAPEDSATLEVVFSPTSTGTKTAQLSIPSNDPDEDPLTVSLQGRGTAAGVTVQVAFLLDASGSIGGSNWNIIVNGLADAVENSLCMPQDGSVELTVVRFASSASTVVGPVVITSGNVATVASDIRDIAFTSGGTCISCAFNEVTDALQNSVYFSPSLQQAINLVTDGGPNSAPASETARDNCITTLQMTESQDVICAEAIGSWVDVDWLRDEIVFPQPGCEWTGTSPTCSGWVRQVTDAEEFAETVCEKLAAIIVEPPVCDFTATPLTGTAPLTVQFTDSSTGNIDTWAWDFDNDGVTDSTQQNPGYTYTEAGIYTVSLTATGLAGSCTETKVAYITVRELPTEEEEPANLKASHLFISPEQVAPNQEVEISINIGNDGGTAGTHSVALYINGNLEDSQTVSVSPGSAKNVVFRATKSEPGTYQVLLEGNEGQFTVTGTADSHWGGPLGTGGIIAIVVFVVALVLGLFFILRRE